MLSNKITPLASGVCNVCEVEVDNGLRSNWTSLVASIALKSLNCESLNSVTAAAPLPLAFEPGFCPLRSTKLTYPPMM